LYDCGGKIDKARERGGVRRMKRRRGKNRKT